MDLHYHSLMAWCLVTAINLNELAKTKHNNKIQLHEQAGCNW